MNYKISVIVPIYGVEKYIERCARSLFEQTLEEIEYIFVDDCTRDNSIAILSSLIKEYPNRQPHVRILKHERNKGLPQARKTGVREATGQYIAHCDSDDWPERFMYEQMYSKAIEDNNDIVYSDYFISDGKINIPQKVNRNSKRLLQGPVWNKIVKRDIYENNDIVYPVNNKAEDGALMTQLSFFASSIGHVTIPLYHYYVNPDSMTRIVSEDECLKRVEQERENTNLRISFLERQDKADDYKADIIEWKWFTRNNLLPIYNKRKYYKLWLNTYPEINKEILLSRDITFRSKYIFLLQLTHLYGLFKDIKDFFKKMVR